MRRLQTMGLLLIGIGVWSAEANAQTSREDALFGAPEADAGLEPVRSAPVDAPEQASSPSGGSLRDQRALTGTSERSKFDTGEVKSDALKVGGSLLLYGQGFWRERQPFSQAAFSAPFLFDAYLDGRPNDRLRGFVEARLQFDPTRLSNAASTNTTAVNSANVAGLTQATTDNPSVALDQLWVSFDIAHRVFLTVGRQKTRWGVSRIWYPSDFLNSRPRDAFNPFDTRLGVDMIKVQIPVESLGWNFYAYGLLGAVTTGSNGITFGQLGGAIRGEFVLGPAELGVGGVWQQGRRPRYEVDISSGLGPIDIYGEVAFRDARDFVLFRYPDGIDADNFLEKLSGVEPYRPNGIFVQVSGGASWQFNYTDKNAAILFAEYFYNPAGFTSPVGYQLQTFAPSVLGVSLDPIQSVSLYGGQHNLAVGLLATSVPGADWISVSLNNIVIISEPSAMTRIDVTFRVLSYLNVQLFAAALYGNTGGQLRFTLSGKQIQTLSALQDLTSPGTGAALMTTLKPLQLPPVALGGVLLRLSI